MYALQRQHRVSSFISGLSTSKRGFLWLVRVFYQFGFGGFGRLGVVRFLGFYLGGGGMGVIGFGMGKAGGGESGGGSGTRGKRRRRGLIGAGT